MLSFVKTSSKCKFINSRVLTLLLFYPLCFLLLTAAITHNTFVLTTLRLPVPFIPMLLFLCQIHPRPFSSIPIQLRLHINHLDSLLKYSQLIFTGIFPMFTSNSLHREYGLGQWNKLEHTRIPVFHPTESSTLTLPSSFNVP